MKNPSPQPDYGGNQEALAKRDRMVLHYGEDTVRASEVAVCVSLMFAVGLIRPVEFGELVEKQCARIDDRRRTHAGFKD